MTEINFTKPSVEIFFDPTNSRWITKVNGKVYNSHGSLDELLAILVNRTVIAESDAYQINKKFNNEGPIVE